MVQYFGNPRNPRRRSYAPPWTPLDLGSKLIEWFDPSYRVYKDAGSTLSAVGETYYRWAGRVSTSNYYEQTTLASRPVVALGANGKYYANCSAINMVPSGNFMPSNPFTAAMMVLKGSGRALAGVANNWLACHWGTGTHAFYNGGFIGIQAAPTGWYRSLVQGNGSECRMFENNADVTSNPTAGSDLPSSGVRLGDTGEPFTGGIGHLVYCNDVLTSGEKLSLDTFFASQAPT